LRDSATGKEKAHTYRGKEKVRQKGLAHLRKEKGKTKRFPTTPKRTHHTLEYLEKNRNRDEFRHSWGKQKSREVGERPERKKGDRLKPRTTYSALLLGHD